MDWRNNQAVGLGAAVVLILGVGIFYWWMNGSSQSAKDQSKRSLKFLCQSTGGTFAIKESQISDDVKAFETYMGPPFGTPTDCKVCSKKDALRAYYCRTCQKWYPYQAGEELAAEIHCPKGHACTIDTDL